ncbi:SAM-dependent methyltransferase [Actinoplanes sp. LDG1-06]|uniref:SAM-dependent methyltransferase n=1 Tax=Paractinoplanes ovalisporus TaxID=2810368 RepID=A0ABS2AF37_9ACTN|nr:SAM-dependent methyltransferase [Actinoplanes ovalisporus]
MIAIVERRGSTLDAGVHRGEDVRVTEDLARLDTNVPETARVWNHLLGGTDNVAADRAVRATGDVYGAVGRKP